LSNGFANKYVPTATVGPQKLGAVFSVRPCRDVINGASWELQSVEWSQSEDWEVDVRWPPAWESGGGYSPDGKDVSRGH
jgi:hypothetical protein